MRLSQSDIDAIKTVVSENCGEDAVVRLFGSRLDDTAKGGDIDLMVELDEAVEHPARLSAWLSVKVMRATQGRKVDVILAAPNLEELRFTVSPGNRESYCLATNDQYCVANRGHIPQTELEALQRAM